YGQIYSTEKSIHYLEYKRQLLQSVVKVAEQLFAVGQVPQQDVFRSTAELTMVQSDIITVQSLLSDQEAKLGALLGQNAPYSIQVDTLTLPPLDSLTTLEAQLGNSNPELKQIKSVELAAQAKTTFARKDAVPDVSVGFSYGYRGALMPDGTKALNMMNFEVGMSLPIFFGARQQKMIDEADFMNRAAKEQYGTAELGLFSQLRSIYANAEAQAKLIPLYSRELIPQYEATYNSSLSSYSVGKTTFAMLIDNLTTLINTKIEFAKIESAYFSADAEILRLVGEGSEDYRGVK
ncbi:MAG TPA: TolC family protein, partial [Candidatus Kryptobacter bacterium]|nr:TolC family protein [Candidatus Kryptobacter bacterium]